MKRCGSAIAPRARDATALGSQPKGPITVATMKERGSKRFGGLGALACVQFDGKTTGGRLRALTELRGLRMKPNQSVAHFCVLLEKLARQANPDSSLDDISMEYAQILLDNLSKWPEHVQLLAALHRVAPECAYNEVKQLALTIEQSKMMFMMHEVRLQAGRKKQLEIQGQRLQKSWRYYQRRRAFQPLRGYFKKNGSTSVGHHK
ncbi:hypothetical protein Aduo_002206 [Ancylostoma duodenale]